MTEKQRFQSLHFFAQSEAARISSSETSREYIQAVPTGFRVRQRCCLTGKTEENGADLKLKELLKERLTVSNYIPLIIQSPGHFPAVPDGQGKRFSPIFVLPLRPHGGDRVTRGEGLSGILLPRCDEPLVSGGHTFVCLCEKSVPVSQLCGHFRIFVSDGLAAAKGSSARDRLKLITF